MKTNDIGKMTRRRRANRIRKGKAVSPVVATLILILVAVAAAAALYLWLVAWQGGVTKQVGSTTTQYTIAVGGSTTVFPVTEKAIPWFEANNSNIKVSDNPGGSGAGELSLCSGSGAIDIAAMSRPMKTTELATCPTAVQTIIGYDAVTPMISANSNANVGGNFVSTGEGALLNLYWLNGGQPTTAAGFPSELGNPATPFAGLTTSATVPNTNVPGYWGIKVGTGAAGPDGIASLLWTEFPQNACYDPTATITAAGFFTSSTVCTYTYSTSATPINVYARADNSGTEEAFDNNVLGISCGADNQLASCGFPTTTSTATVNKVDVATGNPALLLAISNDKNALGFNSWGLSTAPTSQGGGAGIVTDVPVQGNSQTSAVTPTLATIKTGIAAGYGVQVTGGYIGWRPLQYVTLGTPTGESERFIQFVLQPSNNQILLESNFYISVDQ